MYEAAASCKEIARAPVTNWEPQRVTFAGNCYAVGHGMKVKFKTDGTEPPATDASNRSL